MLWRTKDRLVDHEHLRFGPVRFHWSDERFLNLFLDRSQPLLGARRSTLKTLDLALQLRFGGSAIAVFGETSRWRPAADILQNTAKGIETLLRLVEPIASRD
jgi:hypothetical protein